MTENEEQLGSGVLSYSAAVGGVVSGTPTTKFLFEPAVLAQSDGAVRPTREVRGVQTDARDTVRDRESVVQLVPVDVCRVEPVTTWPGAGVVVGEVCREALGRGEGAATWGRCDLAERARAAVQLFERDTSAGVRQCGHQSADGVFVLVDHLGAAGVEFRQPGDTGGQRALWAGVVVADRAVPGDPQAL